MVLFDNSFHFSLGQLLCLYLLPVAKVTKTMLKIVIRVLMRCNTCISFHSLIPGKQPEIFVRTFLAMLSAIFHYCHCCQLSMKIISRGYFSSVMLCLTLMTLTMKLTETLSAIYDARLRDPDSDFWSFWFLNILTMLLRKEKIYNQSLSKIILRESQTASKIFGRT